MNVNHVLGECERGLVFKWGFFLLYYHWMMCDNTSFVFCFHVNGFIGYWLLGFLGLVMLLSGVLIYVSMSAMLFDVLAT